MAMDPLPAGKKWAKGHWSCRQRAPFEASKVSAASSVRYFGPSSPMKLGSPDATDLGAEESRSAVHRLGPG